MNDSYATRLINLFNAGRKIIDNFAVIFENYFVRKKSRKSLIILDDIYPHLLSAFRIAEYNYYLRQFSDSQVYSTAATFPLIREKRGFAEVVSEYESLYSQFKGKVLKFNRFRKLNCELIYLIFLNNAFNFIDYIDESGTPFVFTLYPGGGFQLNQPDSDRKLRRVFYSPNFRKVIVTQKISYEYLVANKFCAPEQVEFIYGGVLPSEQLKEQVVSKKYYKDNKNSFDICFAANKYMEKGIDKGFDVFIDVANKLHEQHCDILFHVIGPFDGSDIDVASLGDSIKFYGIKKTDFFPSFYSGMDLILSPNVPFVLAPGAFDGFPTGCCIEAGLSGVAVFCTDHLKLNTIFQDRDEIVIISEQASEIVGTVLEYYNNPGELYKMSANGKAAFEKIFDIEYQMGPRLNVLSHYVENNHTSNKHRN